MKVSFCFPTIISWSSVALGVQENDTTAVSYYTYCKGKIWYMYTGYSIRPVVDYVCMDEWM